MLQPKLPQLKQRLLPLVYLPLLGILSHRSQPLVLFALFARLVRLSPILLPLL